MIRRLEQDISQLIDNEVDKEHYLLDEVRVLPINKRLVIAVKMDRIEGGITLDDCASWNKRFGMAIESANMIDGAYVVEVASPGLDRKLKTARDFERVLGKRLKIVFRHDDGRALQGLFILRDVRPEGLTLTDVSGKEDRVVILNAVLSAKLDF